MLTPKKATVEKRQRLAHSCLWEFQASYYQQQGIQAWVSQVPYFVTSNPFVAKTYAHVIQAFARDLPEGEPLTILELGAGSGKFTHHLLSRLANVLPESVKLRYIMSDFAQKNLECWRTHPQLAAWVERGWLDFATFDCLSSTHLTPEHSGTRLQTDQPAFVIANYVFDTLPQDAFSVDDQTLHASLLTLKAPKSCLKGKQLIEATDLEYQFSQKPITPSFFPHASWNQALADYQEHLGQGHFLTPTGGLTCLKNLQTVFPKGFFVLSTDKGYCRLEDMKGGSPPAIADHGSLSTMVNYDFMARVVTYEGGHHLLQSTRPGIRTCAFCLGVDRNSLDATFQAAHEAINDFSVTDYFELHRLLKQERTAHTLTTLLAYLRLSGWDPHVLNQQHDRLNQACPEATHHERTSLREGLGLIMRNYYWLPDGIDTPGQVGMLFHNLHCYREAIPCYQQSLDAFGERFHIRYNIGCCYAYLREKELALTELKRALALKPQDQPCLDLIESVEQNRI